jgi:hypothetical protein
MSKATYVITVGYCLFVVCFMANGQPSQVIPSIGDSARSVFVIEQHDRSFEGKDYRLYIAAAKEPAALRRPVLYMLDGNGQFPILLNQIKNVSAGTPLIVGIGYPIDRAYPKERTRDYVPAEYQGEGGGAEDFYRFIIQDVKPFIESHYSVDTTRQTLCGHSHGGLFALYVAFEHPSAFQHYVAASPSLWWAKGKTVPDRRPLFTTGIPQSLTLTMGEYEENPSLDTLRAKLPPAIQEIKNRRRGGMPVRRLAAIMAEEVPAFRLIVYPGKNHGSSVPLFLMEALLVAGNDIF